MCSQIRFCVTRDLRLIKATSARCLRSPNDTLAQSPLPAPRPERLPDVAAPPIMASPVVENDGQAVVQSQPVDALLDHRIDGVFDRVVFRNVADSLSNGGFSAGCDAIQGECSFCDGGVLGHESLNSGTDHSGPIPSRTLDA